ncbi:two-component sensor histidine kinase [Arsenicibacter rosenii]|uniref:histidine kinase n=1 Tax=Arsenicibacter rosenii TaxID=1750698 RepID=A0A1S2VI92_9BACT|nr:two-component sensor histidine kinase [Arsenicibacter rosenii]
MLAILNGILTALYDWQFENLVFLLAVLILLFFFLLSVPIGLSFSLVQDYTRTHTSLRKNLDEVKRLSERSLAQEQEKQQILAAQNETLERLVQERTAALNESIETLKATQDQLVQKEKMASLGELTAGIAHEIQNPLNFVNNFSEVSADLVAEIEDERQRPADDRDEGLVDEILGDLRQNLEKITHHGKRASSIVKGMLEHSRTSSGEKQPTDLNALSDEYLRLAYHGYRAAHKTFNCQLVTDFDPALPPVNLATQDIGRVVLNLLNNAFYALDQKQQTAPKGFQPTVWLSTSGGMSGGSAAGRSATNAPGFVTLVIRDNGPGIPEDIIGKVFQPFFTTKPTGEGTGLGLSLSFDIITKAHQGDFFVDSTPGEGTTFTIKLPVM